MERKTEILIVSSPDQPPTALKIRIKTEYISLEISQCISDLVKNGRAKIYTDREAFFAR